MPTRAGAAHTNSARHGSGQHSSRLEGEVIRSVRDSTICKKTSILLDWIPSPAPEDAPGTMVTSRNGLNSLLASLGRPAFDVMGEFGPGGVAVTCTTLTDGKFDQMKALLFATVDAVATPSSPCRAVTLATRCIARPSGRRSLSCLKWTARKGARRRERAAENLGALTILFAYV